MPTPIATTDTGRVQGVQRPTDVAFLGVPYAAPPVGPLRLQAPVPHEPWDGDLDCTRFGPTSPQPVQGITLIPEPIVEGDACRDPDAWLSLNVFTPSLEASGLPVYVYFHGGGYTQGTASSSFYDGRSFTRDGVVVVSVGYRLGAEGFLAIEGAPANRGVLDWVAALEWVQRNIAAFGGDPDRVTIGGQSAGGGACTILATNPRASGLFRRAIPMSGSALRLVSSEQAAARAAAVAAALGVEPTLDAIAARTPAELVAAQGAAPEGAPLLGLGPVLDGEVIPVDLLSSLDAGAGADLDVLLGATLEEMNALFRAQVLDEDQLLRRLQRLGADEPAARALIATREGVDAGEVHAQSMTDTTFRLPAIRVAEAHLGAGGAGRAWHYDVRWRSPIWGAVHCVDVPFLWDVLDADGVTALCGDAPPQELADALHAAWVGFITDGDPGWPAYDLDRRATMVFGGEGAVTEVVDDALHLERTTFTSPPEAR